MSGAVRMVPIGPGAAAEMFALHAPLFDPPWTVESIADQLTQPGCGAFAVWGEGLEGFILFRTAADEAEILMVAVAARAQGRGFGQALLTQAIRGAEEAGARTMFLDVAVDNAPALRLYERVGFEQAGRRPRYYSRLSGEPVDALLFRRSLGEQRLTGAAHGPMVAS